MRPTVTDAQRDMAFRILITAMAILRDDQPFNPAHTIFGSILAARRDRGVVCVTEYSFVNPVLPDTQIIVVVVPDPLDPSADRTKIKQVVRRFTIRFNPLLTDINRSTLEDLLQVDIGYWIDGNGERRPGNDMGTVPPQIRLHHYRYRASDLPTSRFPVDVEFAFGDPGPKNPAPDEPKTPVLMDVRLNRDYSALKRQHRE
ncbi:hypothetical protein HDG34_002006 [Paraburkholderia sp. HC6.4b]|uniref:hypothetical protein n=1 Tax=unclassified Paraburkholderia TaxID=2615204 RepID=UPI00160BCC7B|nr:MULTISPECIES: hypothetical protein [unclassified Paraburkholderia]MBB5408074.1 hypothetical protein [Paraburkholderia sp. HC6.4b]MBB5453065.1 hypothetical protein [Paraburkholderia sp. Kb1A]